MPGSTQTPTPPPLLRVLDAPLAHHSPPPGPDLDAILAHNEQTLPSSDDMPLADGRIQQDPLSYSRDSVRYHFREQSDRVAVEGDMFVYYIGRDRAGLPALASVVPDIYVVFGVPDRPDRDSYVLFHEPDADIRFVLEIASQSTWVRDHGHKRHVYASLHVAEYFLFDPPTADKPAQIMGLTLSGLWYEELPQEVLPNGHRGVRSNVLGLAIYVRDGQLRWYDPASGKDLLNYEELHRLRDEAMARDHAQAASGGELYNYEELHRLTDEAVARDQAQAAAARDRPKRRATKRRRHATEPKRRATERRRHARKPRERRPELPNWRRC